MLFSSGRFISVIKTREDWVIIKHTSSRSLFMYYYYLLELLNFAILVRQCFAGMSFSTLSVKIKFCDPSVLNFKQSKIFKKFLDNREQAKSIFKILTFKANWKRKNA